MRLEFDVRMDFGFWISSNTATIMSFPVVIHEFSLILEELDIGLVEFR